MASNSKGLQPRRDTKEEDEGCGGPCSCLCCRLAGKMNIAGDTVEIIATKMDL